MYGIHLITLSPHPYTGRAHDPCSLPGGGGCSTYLLAPTDASDLHLRGGPSLSSTPCPIGGVVSGSFDFHFHRTLLMLRLPPPLLPSPPSLSL